jgi:phage gpG-like protein
MREMGENGPILKASGSLFYEMTGAQTAIDEIVTGKYNRVVIGGGKLHGVNKIKFKVHMGGGHGWHGSVIPARPFIPQSVNDLTKEEQKTLSKKFRDHMSEMEAMGKGYRGRMFKWK